MAISKEKKRRVRPAPIKKELPNVVLTFDEYEKQVQVEKQKAYKEAAICTLRKLELFSKEPIIEALKDWERYRKYLIKTYDIKPLDYKRPRSAITREWYEECNL